MEDVASEPVQQGVVQQQDMDDTLLPGAEAIYNVSIALKRVQDDLAMKNEEIAGLREKNKELELEIDEVMANLTTTHQNLKLRETELQESTNRNQDLFRSLSAEHSAFSELQEGSKGVHEEVTYLEQENLKLLDQQVEQRKVKNALNNKVFSLKETIDGLNQEKQKYKSVFKELENKLRTKLEMYDAQKREWKDQGLQIMKQLQTKEQAVRISKRKTADLSENLLAITDKNTELENQLQLQEKNLADLVNSLEENKKQTMNYTSENEKLRHKQKQNQAAQNKSAKELQKSSDQLRVMAEKVFQLLGQLQKMEEWKVEGIEESKALSTQMSQLVAKEDALAKQLELVDRQREKLEANGKSVEEKLAVQQQELDDLKAKFMHAETAKNNLTEKLKGQEHQLTQVTANQLVAATKLQTEQLARSHEKKTLNILESKVTDMETSAKILMKQATRLEKLKGRQVEEIERKEKELQEYKQKEEYFARVQTEMMGQHIDDSEFQLNTADPVFDADEFPEASPFRHTQLRVRRALQGKQGAALIPMLKSLKLSEKTLISWSHDPVKLVEGLQHLYDQHTAHEKAVKKAKKAEGAKEDKLDSLLTNSKDLMRRLQTSEEHKTKSVMRLVSMLAENGQPTVDEPDHAQPPMLLTFQAPSGATQQEGEESKASENTGVVPSQPLSKGISIVQLSDNGIEDREVVLLVGSLRNNAPITEIDLRGNRVASHGLLTLVTESLLVDSRVEVIDMQQNFVTFGALEALAIMLLDYSIKYHASQDDPSVSVGATFETAGPHPGGLFGGLESAGLRKEKNALLPVVEVHTPAKSLSVDLRFNRLQRADESAKVGSMKKALASVTRLLALVEAPLQMRLKELEAWTGTAAMSTYRAWERGENPPPSKYELTNYNSDDDSESEEERPKSPMMENWVTEVKEEAPAPLPNFMSSTAAHRVTQMTVIESRKADIARRREAEVLARVDPAVLKARRIEHNPLGKPENVAKASAQRLLNRKILLKPPKMAKLNRPVDRFGKAGTGAFIRPDSSIRISTPPARKKKVSKFDKGSKSSSAASKKVRSRTRRESDPTQSLKSSSSMPSLPRNMVKRNSKKKGGLASTASERLLPKVRPASQE